jgi:glycosyltransferase involved in cell wall biosynthesis
VNVLLWHVHGSWTTAFVQGGHRYLVPVVADRGPDGRGRAATWDWPANVEEVAPSDLRNADIDVVVVQRSDELTRLVVEWTGRRPGPDLPTVYVEHNAPQGRIDAMRHPAADRPDLRIVHVTHFNDLFWDCGATPTTVIEHGIVDPGHRYTGELERVAVMVNEPVRRGRVTGTDLLPAFARSVDLDVFGMDVRRLTDLPVERTGVFEDLPQDEVHRAVARRRAYLHPVRWTSLGLSLLEAMQLGMPVAALATTEVVAAVPPEAGVVSTDPTVLTEALQRWMADPAGAEVIGKEARRAALDRYGLRRFLADWDRTLEEVAA